MIKSHLLYSFLFLILCCCLQGCQKDMIVSDCDLLDETLVLDSSKINNKVLIIGIDGFRSDAMTQEITPFIYDFSERNTYKNLSHLTEKDTYSGPNWSSILTGVHYNKHNVTDNSFSGSRFNLFPTFFSYIERNLDFIKTASIVNWTPINQYVLSEDVDYSPNSSINDSLVYEKARDLLMNNSPIKADIIFLHFDELDAAGHSFGFSADIQEYRETLTMLDSYVDSLIAIIDSKRLSGEDWMCFLISDHGGDGTGHGDYSNIKIRETVFIVEHPSLNFKQNYNSNQTDLASTILDFIGLSSKKFDCKKDGESVLE